MSEKTGGPAFPIVEILDANWKIQHGTKGMTLRDYFAAKAMPAIYDRVESGGFERVATLSYQLADAMLAERAK